MVLVGERDAHPSVLRHEPLELYSTGWVCGARYRAIQIVHYLSIRHDTFMVRAV